MPGNDSSLPRARRVLIGIDFRDAALAASRWIIELFGPASQYVLAHVVHAPALPSFHPARAISPPNAAALEPALAKARASLRGFAATLPFAPERIEVQPGSVPECLAELATAAHADMIAVGASAERTGTWKRVGFTTDRLLRQSRVPVMVVPGDEAAIPSRILAAVDDAEIGRTVLRSANELAQHFGAELVALHVMQSVAVSASAPARMRPEGGWPAMLSGSSAVHAAAREWLWDLLRDMGAKASSTTTALAVGDAGQEILAHARFARADMIVVGRHGAHTNGRYGTGAVTRHVLRGAACPVYVVPGLGDTRLRITGAIARHAASALPSNAARQRAAVASGFGKDYWM